jgi:hypothetical protein
MAQSSSSSSSSFVLGRFPVIAPVGSILRPILPTTSPTDHEDEDDDEDDFKDEEINQRQPSAEFAALSMSTGTLT